MNASMMKKHERCLEMLRRFASDFDRQAADWLQANDDTVGDVLTRYLDRLTAAQRIDVYRILFGFFRKRYKQVMDVRLQVEQDTKCRQELKRIEESHRDTIQKPYLPVTDEELFAVSEKDLRHSEPARRYLGALGVWILTKNSHKVVPTLLAILKNKGAEARVDAAVLLGQVYPLDEDAIQTLREIANDAGDPVQLVAKDALKKAGQLSG